MRESPIVDGRRIQARSASKGNLGRVGFPSIPAWFGPPRLMKSMDAEEVGCHGAMPESASVCRTDVRKIRPHEVYRYPLCKSFLKSRVRRFRLREISID